MASSQIAWQWLRSTTSFAPRNRSSSSPIVNCRVLLAMSCPLPRAWQPNSFDSREESLSGGINQPYPVSDTRDGANGLTVWAVATLIGAMLATSGVSTITRGAGAAAGAVMQAAGSAAGGAAGALGDQLDYFAGLVQRGDGTAIGKPEVRREVGTILARSLRSGEVSPGDRDYMVNLVAAETATPPEEVGKRVDAALQQFNEAQQAAIDAAETARVAGIISAFAIAATLFVAAAAAYMAAVAGGKHRDENIAFRTLR